MFVQNAQYKDYSLSLCVSLSLKLTWYQSQIKFLAQWFPHHLFRPTTATRRGISYTICNFEASSPPLQCSNLTMLPTIRKLVQRSVKPQNFVANGAPTLNTFDKKRKKFASNPNRPKPSRPASQSEPRPKPTCNLT